MYNIIGEYMIEPNYTYPTMTAEDHAEEQAMEQASLDYDIAQDMNTEDLMEYYRDCDHLDEIEACI